MAKHLGGHNWITHVDHGAMKYLFDQGYKTMIDVGCGPGGAIEDARRIGFNAIGIDGDKKLDGINQDLCIRQPEQLPFILFHDYTKGQLPEQLRWSDKSTDLKEFDIAWSVEFLEHVEEKYLPNIMDTFQRCKVVVMTHALPDETGG